MIEAGNNTAVAVHDLAKRFAEQVVLREVSLSVKRGEVCAVLGASGSGKTTFLRCLNGLESFDSGSIELAGVTLRPTCRPRNAPSCCGTFAAASAWCFSSSTCFRIARRWAT